MTIGEDKLKYIAFVLTFLMFFAFCGQNLFAQEISVELPGPEHVKSIWQSIKQGANSIFQKVERIGKGISGFAPFFENIGKGITSWWSSGARPWFEYLWTNCNIYLNQEIRIE